MAESEVLNVEVRQETGRRQVRKLRSAGKTPAVIYGHGETVSLSVPSDQLEKLISHGERLIKLAGGESGPAFIRDVQWDLYGKHVVHVDFTRVEAGEMLETTVALELRGEAPGTKMGGEVEHVLREMALSCPPRSMTDHLDVDVSGLEVGGRITVGDLVLPEGAKAVLDANELVAQCVDKSGAEEAEVDETPAVGPAEPEVIGEKKDDEG